MARLASASSDKTDDAVEEADVPHGALTVPLLRHQRRALAWMTARESGTGPLGGMLADDQVALTALHSRPYIVLRCFHGLCHTAALPLTVSCLTGPRQDADHHFPDCHQPPAPSPSARAAAASTRRSASRGGGTARRRAGGVPHLRAAPVGAGAAGPCLWRSGADGAALCRQQP